MAMFYCSKCKELLSVDKFDNFKVGRVNHCKECKEFMREYRNKAYCKEYRTNPIAGSKFRARNILFRAIGRGEVTKTNICVSCGAIGTECHHEDYSAPLEFVELCRKCHLDRHKYILEHK